MEEKKNITLNIVLSNLCFANCQMKRVAGYLSTQLSFGMFWIYDIFHF